MHIDASAPKKPSEATQTLRAGCSKADPQGRLQYTVQLIARSVNKHVNLKTGRPNKTNKLGQQVQFGDSTHNIQQSSSHPADKHHCIDIV